MEQHWRLVLHVTCVIEPHAVNPSDRFEEIEDKAIPDEAGPSGGAGGSGGSVAAASFTNAVWFQILSLVRSWQTSNAQARNSAQKGNAMNKSSSADAA